MGFDRSGTKDRAAGLLFSIGVALAGAAPAVAQIPIVTIDGTGSPACVTYITCTMEGAPCTASVPDAGTRPGTCTAVTGGDLACVSPTSSVDSFTGVRCCSGPADPDCAGTCASVGSSSTYACIPSGMADAYCVTSSGIATTTLRACLTTPGGNATTDINMGDCDGDHVDNQRDCRPCIHAVQYCEAGMPDAGSIADGGVTGDGGSSPVDAGAADDASVEAMDASRPPMDGGGEPMDASRPPMDGGGEPMDAGRSQARDAGHHDAGPVGYLGDVRGGGGCNCRAAGGSTGDGAGAGLGALLLFGAVLGRRRRRSASR